MKSVILEGDVYDLVGIFLGGSKLLSVGIFVKV